MRHLTFAITVLEDRSHPAVDYYLACDADDSGQIDDTTVRCTNFVVWFKKIGIESALMTDEEERATGAWLWERHRQMIERKAIIAVESVPVL